MSDKPTSPEFQPTDSRLHSFLRQATGILVTEKGLTPACQVKLQSLADRIKLPPELFAEAIRRLQSSVIEFDALTRYEAAFLDFLQQEFEKLVGNVLSPRLERRAINIAQTKYQLTESRAEQLIDAQADVAQVSRILPGEVHRFTRRFIGQTIGKRQYLDDSMRERLYRMGRDWGLNELDVDQIALSHLARNRSSSLKLRSRKVIPWMLLGAALAGFLWFSQLNPWRGQGLSGRPSDPLANGPGREPAGEPGMANPATRQLTDETNGRIQQYRVRFADDPARRNLATGLVANDGEVRAEAYRNLIVELLTPLETRDRRAEPVDLELISHLFVDEPDVTLSARIIDQTVDAIEGAPPFNVAHWRKAYRALQLWSMLAESAAVHHDSIRMGLIQSRSPAWLATQTRQSATDDVASREQRLSEMLARRQWNQLLNDVYRSPKRSAVLISPLIELTKKRLDSESLRAFGTEAVLVVLNTEPGQFQLLRDTVAGAIEASSPLQLLPWIELLNRHPGQPWIRQLREWLVAATRVQPASQQVQDVDEALRGFAFEVRFERFPEFRARVKDANLISQVRLQSSTVRPDIRQLPDAIAAMAAAVNLELGLRQVVRNAQWWADPDVHLTGLPTTADVASLKSLVAMRVDQVAPSRSMASNATATASEIRSKNAALSRLSPDDPSSLELKLLAFHQLHRVASRFPDLSGDEAAVVAEFLVADFDLEQQLDLQTRLGAFSHWSNVILAWADRLEDSTIGLDWAMTISRLLLRTDLTEANSETWKHDLKNQILAAVQRKLADRIALDGSDPGQDWLRLEVYLGQLYRQRLRMLGGVEDGDVSPSLTQLTAEIAAQLVKPVEQPLDEWTVTALTPNPVEQIVALQQVAIHELCRSRPDFLNPTGALAQFERRLANCPTSGDRLWECERMLLALAMRKRQQALREAMNRL